MTTKSLSLLLALAIVCTLAPPVIAQKSAAGRSWLAVQALASGTKLSVRMKNGETIEGRLDTVFDAGLTLSRKGGTITLSRDAIQKAYRVGGRQVGKSALMGLGIGAGIGAEAAWGGPHESGEAALPVLVLAAGGAIIGTTAGLVVGLFRRKKVLVYESR